MNKSEKKLIALDLDGTTLTREKKISPRTKRILLHAVEQGHHVVIATGRPPRSALAYYHELGLRTPMVNFNGALVHHAYDEQWGGHHFPLDLETALGVIQTCEQFDIENVMVEIRDTYYLKHHCSEMIRVFGDGVDPLGIGHLPQLVDNNPTAVLIQPNNKRIKELRDHLQEIHADVVEHRQWGVPWNVIEVVKAGISKASSLKLIADSFGVSREQVIAFGDEDNDMEMIQYAGLGVAMGNANPILKTVADRITDTNDSDGIASILEKLL